MTDPDDLQASLARLVAPDGRVFQGLTVAGTSTSVTLDFRPDDCPSLLFGEEVRLEFPRLGDGAPLGVDAVPVYRGEDEHRRRYRFELLRGAGRTVTALINRRGALRVRPPEGTRLPVRVRAAGLAVEVECELGDLSLTGAALVARADGPSDPLPVDRLRLAFELPGTEGTIEADGLVRHRTPVAEAGEVRYGIEFVPAAAGELHALQNRLSGWVMERQAELLRHLGSAAATVDER